MTQLSIGGNATLSLGDNGRVTVVTNGGFGSVTVTPNVGSPYTMDFGPLPYRQTFHRGLEEGGAVSVSNISADSFDYDASGVVIAPWKIVSTTTYTLLATDTKLAFTHASGCAVSVPSTLPAGFECSCIAMQAAAVTVSAGGGATLLPGTRATAAAGAIFAIVGTPTAGTSSITGAVA